MTFATLEGHTDAGYITFSGSYNAETDEITFSIFNETRENHGAAFATFTGRAAQRDQWEDEMGNTRKFLDKGKSEVKMTEIIKTYQYDQNQPMGKGELLKEKKRKLMNNYLLEKLIFTFVMVIIALGLFLIGKKISINAKYNQQRKFYLSLVWSGVIGMVVFYPIAFLDEQYGIGYEYLTAMTLVLLPLSIITAFIGLIVFLIKK